MAGKSPLDADIRGRFVDVAKAIRVLMDLSPDGSARFLATPEFWDALELCATIAQIFDSRSRRRDRIARGLLRKTPRNVQREFFRILSRMPTIAEQLATLAVHDGR